MKKEKAIGMIGIIILIAFIITSTVLIYNNVKKQIIKSKDGNVQSNMLLIQGACKSLSNTASVSKDTKLIGTKLSEFERLENSEEQNNNNDENNEDDKNEEDDENNKQSENLNNTDKSNIDNDIIQDFLSKKIIKENYDKFYILTDDDIKKLKINVKNEKDSYYIINYEKNEVYITKGIDQKYSLTDINENK